MKVTQLIYSSHPFGYDDLALAGILSSARANNTRDEITGALICREDIYLQLLEGPSHTIAQTYARILRDDRHTDVQQRLLSKVEHRLFPDWAMRHDPARSWMWSASDVSNGCAERASGADVLAIFERLAREPEASPLETSRDQP